MIETQFTYPSRGVGRPQILLIGNGLEYNSGQKSWGELIDELTVADALPITKRQKKDLPFPLLYQVLSTHSPAPLQLTEFDILDEEKRLASAIHKLVHATNEYLDIIPTLDADHIMTTNYSYCVESAFYPNEDFRKPYVRNLHRFRTAKNPTTGKILMEKEYRLHSGYLVQSVTRKTGIWHIHGECAVPRGIVLGHDRYGRLLQRVEHKCSMLRYRGNPKEVFLQTYASWPELFLHGDVYILGLNLEPNEFDLWWLIRRKQRERYSDGRIFFYERRPENGYEEAKHLLMKSSGIALCDAGCTSKTDYDTFYKVALRDIKQRIAASRNQ